MSMKRIPFFYIVVVLLCGLLYWFFTGALTFPLMQERYNSISPDVSGEQVFKGRKFVQSFRPGALTGEINGLCIRLNSFEGGKKQCSVRLLEDRTGRVLMEQFFRLRKRTDPWFMKVLVFPEIHLDKDAGYRLEIEAGGALLATPLASGEGKGGLTVDEAEVEGGLSVRFSSEKELSVLAQLFMKSGGSAGFWGELVLRLLALLCLTCAGVALLTAFRQDFKLSGLASPTAGGATTAAVSRFNNPAFYFFLCASLFLVLETGASFFSGRNTYARLAGAEDDAFITYRYSANIAAGEGFRFNSDEKTLGTTTPLYALLLSLFHWLTPDMPAVSLVINLLSIICSGFLLFRLLMKELPPGLAALGGVVFVFFPLFYRALGMETHFLIFLLFLALNFFYEKRYPAAFFVIGLATLTRSESILMLLVFLGTLGVRREYKRGLISLGCFMAAVLPWVIFSILYFGSVIPNTFFIKTQGGLLDNSFLTRLSGIFHSLITFRFMDSLFIKGFTVQLKYCFQYYHVWLIFFGIALLMAAVRIFVHEFSRNLFLWILLYVLGFSLLNTPYFTWYYVLAFSILPVAYVMGACQVGKVVYLAAKKKRSAEFTVIALLLSLLIFEGWGVFNIFYGQWYARNMERLERYDTYRDIARLIHERVPAGKSVAMEEIGIVGYYTKNKIWDFYSLIHGKGKLPAGFPSESSQRIPYMLTVMASDYVILTSQRYQSRMELEDYSVDGFFPVYAYDFDPEFYYLLLKKRENQMPVLGACHLQGEVSGRVRIRGWVFGSEETERIALWADGRVVADNIRLTQSPADFIQLFSHNSNAKRAIFSFFLDSREFPNGYHRLMLTAYSKSKSGSFWRGDIMFSN